MSEQLDRLSPNSALTEHGDGPSNYFIALWRKLADFIAPSVAASAALRAYADATADLPGGASLPDTVAAYNALLAAMRTPT